MLGIDSLISQFREKQAELRWHLELLESGKMRTHREVGIDTTEEEKEKVRRNIADYDAVVSKFSSKS